MKEALQVIGGVLLFLGLVAVAAYFVWSDPALQMIFALVLAAGAVVGSRYGYGRVRGWLYYRGILRKIDRLTAAEIRIPTTDGTVEILEAIRRGIVRVVELRGRDITVATLTLESIDGSSQSILITVGTQLVSSGNHQTMAVRRNTVANLQRSSSFTVPVSCLNFYKSIPTEQHTFTSMAPSDPLVASVLAIGILVGDAERRQSIGKPGKQSRLLVDDFVIQLAVWNALENVSPSVVALGPQFGERRVASSHEAGIALAIAKVERSMAHNYETGGLRRIYLRGHDNILKRVLVHVAGFNLGLVMQKIVGYGTPRGLQGRFLRLLALIIVAIQALLLGNSVSRPAQPHTPARRRLLSPGWLSGRFGRQPAFATGC